VRSSLLCFTLIGCFAGLSSCSSGSSGGSPAVQPGAFFKPAAVGQFVSTKEAPLEKWGSPPAGFGLPETPNCKADAPETFDAGIHVGDVIRSTNSSATSGFSSSVTQTNTVQSIDATQLTQLLSISDIRLSPPINGLPNEIQAQSKCTISKDPHAPFSCDTKFLNWTPDAAATRSKNCWLKDIPNKEMSVTGTAAVGTFITQGGQSVQALRTRSVRSNGQIVCQIGNEPETNEGPGHSVEDVIETTDLVTFTASNCTQVSRVYNVTTLVLETGAVISMYQNEVLSAPRH
jgi:hypothetical protein